MSSTMHRLLALSLFATACTGVPLNGTRYDSVRDRLSDAPTSLYLRDEASSGSVTARRRDQAGWTAGTAELAIEHGYVSAALDDSGQLAIDQFDIALAPIALDGVFSKPAQLVDVRLHLAEPVRAGAEWTSDDDATAAFAMVFAFDWSIAFDGGQAYPLATQQLPRESVEVVLGGNGDYVGALLELDAEGELWNWADVIEITHLELSLLAETVD
jgi:hypothetical protein